MTRSVISFIVFMIALLLSGCDEAAMSNESMNGKGGSMARFAISSNYLYSVNFKSLQVMEIAGNGSLTPVGKVDLENTIVETIFALGGKLYIGTSTSMVIYDISTPAKPTLISTYSHVVACDPVVVQGDIAYVTIRSTGCRNNGVDLLDIIDIKDPANPQVISSTMMLSPYGLGIEGNLLFVCQGEYGLFVYDVSDPKKPFLTKTFPEVWAYDVIPMNGLLILTGSNGIVQYSYANGTVNELSKITTGQ